MTLKKLLPLADQSFAQIIDFNYIYADKTKYIYDLVREPKGSFFLSRPRRFGKTVLLHTLHELFSGNRERFRGLWIEGSDYSFPRHPVIFHSLSVRSQNSEVLDANIISDLSKIAKKENLLIDEITPDMYLSSLIQALYKKYNSTVVVLIDEYDSPVTDSMGNLKVAEANATVLRKYFAALKKPEVSPCLRFTFVTGITRYSLTSMDSAANHLIDISLKPQYAGLCGFTLEEFELLFADRFEETLAELKNAGKNIDIADTSKLRSKILYWYDGYNWGGQTRVLNPYSILNFFSDKSFGNYWVRIGRPGHLTALIRENLADFLDPTKESNSYSDLTKSELSQLQAVPVLFHSGYLTIDKINVVTKEDPSTHEITYEDYYSFKFPNYEVSSSYKRDCLNSIFKFKSTKSGDDELKSKGEQLKKAFLTKDAQAVSDLFCGFFSPITSYQRPEGEKTFHALVQMLLSGMGFNVLSEVSGATRRMDLCLELSDQVYLILELKYCPLKKKLTKKEENQALAALAKRRFTIEELEKCLADLAILKLGDEIIFKAKSKGRGREMTEAEENQALAEEAIRSISKEDREKALAIAARTRLTNEEIEVGLATAVTTKSHEIEEIDRLLSETADKALMAIAKKSYSSILGNKPKKTIELGLAISGYGTRVKAAFGPAKTKASPQSKRQSKGASSKV